MDEKAQGALEYLLLIGGAVLVAAIALTILSGMAGTGKNASDIGNEKITHQLDNLENL